MITVPPALLQELAELIERLEETGIQAEDAASRLNQSLGDLLGAASERSRLAHEAHKLLRRIQA